jgi:signal transduction histidine kinase
MVISTMFALRSLKSRILAVLFFLLFFALLFDFFYLIPSIREGHVAAARRSQAELARQISSDLDFSFRQGIAEIEAIAQLPDIVSMKQARIDRALSELNTVTQFFNYYFVLDTAGSWVSYPSRPHMVGKRIPEKNMGWVRKTVAEDRTVFLDVVKSMVGTLVTGFSTPIRSEEGEVVGILRGVIVTTKTNALLSSLTPSRGGEPGYAYVVSSNGWLIAHPHIRQSADAFTVYDYGEYGPVAEVMQGNTGISEYEYEGEAWVAAYRPIPATNWGVVVQQPKAAILQSVGKATRLLVWLAGVLFFLSVILLMVGLQYSLRPLARLVGEIRSRTLPKDASFSDDEVGQIGREFHTLYSELSQSEAELKRLNQELEARVRERTRELQEANERLRHEMAERRRTEEQLLHAQKMEAVGRLTGGVAHEFNNILTSIMGFGEFLLDGLNRNEPLRRNAEMVVDSAERAAKLTEGLLAYSRKQVTQFELSDLNSIIRDMHEILAALAGENVELALMPSPGSLPVRADRMQMEQVLMNLAGNALDAMPRGGRLSIDSERLSIPEELALSHFQIPPGTYAVLTVKDTGTGMSREQQEMIFEPFFTTKDVGKGTGLGLSIVYGIVRNHHGFIDVQSGEGKGTSFRIYLPVSAEEPALPVKERVEQPIGGAETILVAEDDTRVRGLLTTILERADYNVIAASDGEEALRKYREHHDGIALLVMDVAMPHLGGAEAYKEIRKMNPDIRALFMSGYAADTLPASTLSDERVAFIPKPVSQKKLLRAIREALS